MSEAYEIYQNGERNIGSLYLEATGIRDAVVNTAEDIHKFNGEFSTVFSDKPLKERIGPAIRLGFNAVITSAIIIATGKSIYARTANTGKLSPSQVYCRYCSIAEGDAITNTGYLRGGRPGNTFFSTDQYYSVTEAQESLALPYPPEIKLDFKIQNSPKVIGPKVVAPNFGQPGGGIEYWSSDLIQVVIISVMDLLK